MQAGETIQIAHSVVERLIARGSTLATAESCSGGLIAHLLTNVSGASQVFVGGVVAYSNEVKMSALGVPTDTLEAHGAVSEAVALAMAAGVRGRLAADYGIGVTGIAGPSGGSPDKPVGLVYVAVAGSGGATAIRHEFPGSRIEVKAQTAEAALQMMWEWLA